MLSTALTFGQPVGEIMPDRDAPRWVAKALYKDLKLDQIVSKLEKKHLKLDKYYELVYIGIVVRVATEKRISYTWEF
jgi:hypothetical protein